MLSDSDVTEMARKLSAAAPAGSEVILFGSRARGTARDDSDANFLVIEPAVEHEIREMARRRRALRGSAVPVDILVTTQANFEKWRETPTSVYCDIAREGRRLADLA